MYCKENSELFGGFLTKKDHSCFFQIDTLSKSLILPIIIIIKGDIRPDNDWLLK